MRYSNPSRRVLPWKTTTPLQPIRIMRGGRTLQSVVPNYSLPSSKRELIFDDFSTLARRGPLLK